MRREERKGDREGESDRRIARTHVVTRKIYAVNIYEYELNAKRVSSANPLLIQRGAAR